MYGRRGGKYPALRYRLDIFAVAILIPNIIFQHILNFQKSVWVKLKEKNAKEENEPTQLTVQETPIFIGSKVIRFYFVN